MTSFKKISFEERFLRWRKKEKLKGPEAMDRFAFFSFVEALKIVSNDFVLKGGNLLWIYTKTPRETVDLDFSTLNLDSHLEVRKVIDKACYSLDDIEFSVDNFQEMSHQNMFGSRFKMIFKAKSGATNKFQLDIVYKLSTDLKIIKTPISDQEVLGASIENIISDKLNSILTKIEFTSRAKDFDDLWRLSQSSLSIDKEKLNNLLDIVGIKSKEIDYKKITEVTEKNWKKQSKRYKDLPSNLEKIINDINNWTNQLNEKKRR